MIRIFGTTHRAALLAGIALSAICASSTARASGFALLEQSATYQGASYAGSAARSDDPSTLFYNPAGMTQLPGYQVSINGSFIMPQANLASGSASLNTPYGPVAAGGFGGDAAATVLLPSVYATAQVAPDWHVGLALTSPFGLSTKYDTESLARYYALTTSLTTYDIAPSVAWQALPELSVAAALRIDVADAHLSEAVDFGSLLGAPGQADGISRLKGSDTALGWQVGLLYQPAPATKIGFDYRSPIFHKLSGSVAFQGPSGQPVPEALVAAVPYLAGGSTYAKVVTPDTFSLSVAQDVGPVTLLAGIDYTLWSRFKNLEASWANGGQYLTQENWNNTVMLSAGADWKLSDMLTLRSGVAVDNAPVSNTWRTPRIPDANRYWLSLGLTWKPIPKLAVSAAYSHLFVSNSSVNQTDLGAGTPNYARGNLTAGYNNQINILSLEATLAF